MSQGIKDLAVPYFQCNESTPRSDYKNIIFKDLRKIREHEARRRLDADGRVGNGNKKTTSTNRTGNLETNHAGKSVDTNKKPKRKSFTPKDVPERRENERVVNSRRDEDKTRAKRDNGGRDTFLESKLKPCDDFRVDSLHEKVRRRKGDDRVGTRENAASKRKQTVNYSKPDSPTPVDCGKQRKSRHKQVGQSRESVTGESILNASERIVKQTICPQRLHTVFGNDFDPDESKMSKGNVDISRGFLKKDGVINDELRKKYPHESTKPSTEASNRSESKSITPGLNDKKSKQVEMLPRVLKNEHKKLSLHTKNVFTSELCNFKVDRKEKETKALSSCSKDVYKQFTTCFAQDAQKSGKCESFECANKNLKQIPDDSMEVTSQNIEQSIDKSYNKRHKSKVKSLTKKSESPKKMLSYMYQNDDQNETNNSATEETRENNKLQHDLCAENTASELAVSSKNTKRIATYISKKTTKQKLRMHGHGKESANRTAKQEQLKTLNILIEKYVKECIANEHRSQGSGSETAPMFQKCSNEIEPKDTDNNCGNHNRSNAHIGEKKSKCIKSAKELQNYKRNINRTQIEQSIKESKESNHLNKHQSTKKETSSTKNVLPKRVGNVDNNIENKNNNNKDNTDNLTNQIMARASEKSKEYSSSSKKIGFKVIEQNIFDNIKNPHFKVRVSSEDESESQEYSNEVDLQQIEEWIEEDIRNNYCDWFGSSTNITSPSEGLPNSSGNVEHKQIKTKSVIVDKLPNSTDIVQAKAKEIGQERGRNLKSSYPLYLESNSRETTVEKSPIRANETELERTQQVIEKDDKNRSHWFKSSDTKQSTNYLKDDSINQIDMLTMEHGSELCNTKLLSNFTNEVNHLQDTNVFTAGNRNNGKECVMSVLCDTSKQLPDTQEHIHVKQPERSVIGHNIKLNVAPCQSSASDISKQLPRCSDEVDNKAIQQVIGEDMKSNYSHWFGTSKKESTITSLSSLNEVDLDEIQQLIDEDIKNNYSDWFGTSKKESSIASPSSANEVDLNEIQQLIDEDIKNNYSHWFGPSKKESTIASPSSANEVDLNEIQQLIDEDIKNNYSHWFGPSKKESTIASPSSANEVDLNEIQQLIDEDIKNNYSHWFGPSKKESTIASPSSANEVDLNEIQQLIEEDIKNNYSHWFGPSKKESTIASPSSANEVDLNEIQQLIDEDIKNNYSHWFGPSTKESKSQSYSNEVELQEMQQCFDKNIRNNHSHQFGESTVTTSNKSPNCSHKIDRKDMHKLIDEDIKNRNSHWLGQTTKETVNESPRCTHKIDVKEIKHLIGKDIKSSDSDVPELNTNKMDNQSPNCSNELEVKDIQQPIDRNITNNFVHTFGQNAEGCSKELPSTANEIDYNEIQQLIDEDIKNNYSHWFGQSTSNISNEPSNCLSDVDRKEIQQLIDGDVKNNYVHWFEASRKKSSSESPSCANEVDLNEIQQLIDEDIKHNYSHWFGSNVCKKVGDDTPDTVTKVDHRQIEQGVHKDSNKTRCHANKTGSGVITQRLRTRLKDDGRNESKGQDHVDLPEMELSKRRSLVIRTKESTEKIKESLISKNVNECDDEIVPFCGRKIITKEITNNSEKCSQQSELLPYKDNKNTHSLRVERNTTNATKTSPGCSKQIDLETEADYNVSTTMANCREFDSNTRTSTECSQYSSNDVDFTQIDHLIEEDIKNNYSDWYSESESATKLLDSPREVDREHRVQVNHADQKSNYYHKFETHSRETAINVSNSCGDNMTQNTKRMVHTDSVPKYQFEAGSKIATAMSLTKNGQEMESKELSVLVNKGVKKCPQRKSDLMAGRHLNQCPRISEMVELKNPSYSHLIKSDKSVIGKEMLDSSREIYPSLLKNTFDVYLMDKTNVNAFESFANKTTKKLKHVEKRETISNIDDFTNDSSPTSQIHTEGVCSESSLVRTDQIEGRDSKNMMNEANHKENDKCEKEWLSSEHSVGLSNRSNEVNHKQTEQCVLNELNLKVGSCVTNSDETLASSSEGVYPKQVENETNRNMYDNLGFEPKLNPAQTTSTMLPKDFITDASTENVQRFNTGNEDNVCHLFHLRTSRREEESRDSTREVDKKHIEELTNEGVNKNYDHWFQSRTKEMFKSVSSSCDEVNMIHIGQDSNKNLNSNYIVEVDLKASEASNLSLHETNEVNLTDIGRLLKDDIQNTHCFGSSAGETTAESFRCLEEVDLHEIEQLIEEDIKNNYSHWFGSTEEDTTEELFQCSEEGDHQKISQSNEEYINHNDSNVNIRTEENVKCSEDIDRKEIELLVEEDMRNNYSHWFGSNANNEAAGSLKCFNKADLKHIEQLNTEVTKNNQTDWSQPDETETTKESLKCVDKVDLKEIEQLIEEDMKNNYSHWFGSNASETREDTQNISEEIDLNEIEQLIEEDMKNNYSHWFGSNTNETTEDSWNISEEVDQDEIEKLIEEDIRNNYSHWFGSNTDLSTTPKSYTDTHCPKGMYLKEIEQNPTHVMQNSYQEVSLNTNEVSKESLYIPNQSSDVDLKQIDQLIDECDYNNSNTRITGTSRQEDNSNTSEVTAETMHDLNETFLEPREKSVKLDNTSTNCPWVESGRSEITDELPECSEDIYRKQTDQRIEEDITNHGDDWFGQTSRDQNMTGSSLEGDLKSLETNTDIVVDGKKYPETRFSGIESETELPLCSSRVDCEHINDWIDEGLKAYDYYSLFESNTGEAVQELVSGKYNELNKSDQTIHDYFVEIDSCAFEIPKDQRKHPNISKLGTGKRRENVNMCEFKPKIMDTIRSCSPENDYDSEFKYITGSSVYAKNDQCRFGSMPYSRETDTSEEFQNSSNKVDPKRIVQCTKENVNTNMGYLPELGSNTTNDRSYKVEKAILKSEITNIDENIIPSSKYNVRSGKNKYVIETSSGQSNRKWADDQKHEITVYAISNPTKRAEVTQPVAYEYVYKTSKVPNKKIKSTFSIMRSTHKNSPLIMKHSVSAFEARKKYDHGKVKILKKRKRMLRYSHNSLFQPNYLKTSEDTQNITPQNGTKSQVVHFDQSNEQKRCMQYTYKKKNTKLKPRKERKSRIFHNNSSHNCSTKSKHSQGPRFSTTMAIYKWQNSQSSEALRRKPNYKKWKKRTQALKCPLESNYILALNQQYETINTFQEIHRKESNCVQNEEKNKFESVGKQNFVHKIRFSQFQRTFQLDKRYKKSSICPRTNNRPTVRLTKKMEHETHTCKNTVKKETSGAHSRRRKKFDRTLTCIANTHKPIKTHSNQFCGKLLGNCEPSNDVNQPFGKYAPRKSLRGTTVLSSDESRQDHSQSDSYQPKEENYFSETLANECFVISQNTAPDELFRRIPQFTNDSKLHDGYKTLLQQDAHTKRIRRLLEPCDFSKAISIIPDMQHKENDKQEGSEVLVGLQHQEIPGSKQSFYSKSKLKRRTVRNKTCLQKHKVHITKRYIKHEIHQRRDLQEGIVRRNKSNMTYNQQESESNWHHFRGQGNSKHHKTYCSGPRTTKHFKQSNTIRNICRSKHSMSSRMDTDVDRNGTLEGIEMEHHDQWKAYQHLNDCKPSSDNVSDQSNGLNELTVGTTSMSQDGIIPLKRQRSHPACLYKPKNYSVCHNVGFKHTSRHSICIPALMKSRNHFVESMKCVPLSSGDKKLKNPSFYSVLRQQSDAGSEFPRRFYQSLKSCTRHDVTSFNNSNSSFKSPHKYPCQDISETVWSKKFAGMLRQFNTTPIIIQTARASVDSDEDLEEILANEETRQLSKNVHYSQLVDFGYPRKQKQRLQLTSGKESQLQSRMTSAAGGHFKHEGNPSILRDHKRYAPHRVFSDEVEQWIEESKEKEQGKYGERKQQLRVKTKPKAENYALRVGRSSGKKQVKAGKNISFTDDHVLIKEGSDEGFGYLETNPDNPSGTQRRLSRNERESDGSILDDSNELQSPVEGMTTNPSRYSEDPRENTDSSIGLHRNTSNGSRTIILKKRSNNSLEMYQHKGNSKESVEEKNRHKEEERRPSIFSQRARRNSSKERAGSVISNRSTRSKNGRRDSSHARRNSHHHDHHDHHDHHAHRERMNSIISNRSNRPHGEHRGSLANRIKRSSNPKDINQARTSQIVKTKDDKNQTNTNGFIKTERGLNGQISPDNHVESKIHSLHHDGHNGRTFPTDSTPITENQISDSDLYPTEPTLNVSLRDSLELIPKNIDGIRRLSKGYEKINGDDLPNTLRNQNGTKGDVKEVSRNYYNIKTRDPQSMIKPTHVSKKSKQNHGHQSKHANNKKTVDDGRDIDNHRYGDDVSLVNEKPDNSNNVRDTPTNIQHGIETKPRHRRKNKPQVDSNQPDIYSQDQTYKDNERTKSHRRKCKPCIEENLTFQTSKISPSDSPSIICTPCKREATRGENIELLKCGPCDSTQLQQNPYANEMRKKHKLTKDSRDSNGKKLRQSSHKENIPSRELKSNKGMEDSTRPSNKHDHSEKSKRKSRRTSIEYEDTTEDPIEYSETPRIPDAQPQLDPKHKHYRDTDGKTWRYLDDGDYVQDDFKGNENYKGSRYYATKPTTNQYQSNPYDNSLDEIYKDFKVNVSYVNMKGQNNYPVPTQKDEIEGKQILNDTPKSRRYESHSKSKNPDRKRQQHAQSNGLQGKQNIKRKPSPFSKKPYSSKIGSGENKKDQCHARSCRNIENTYYVENDAHGDADDNDNGDNDNDSLINYYDQVKNTKIHNAHKCQNEKHRNVPSGEDGISDSDSIVVTIDPKLKGECRKHHNHKSKPVRDKERGEPTPSGKYNEQSRNDVESSRQTSHNKVITVDKSLGENETRRYCHDECKGRDGPASPIRSVREIVPGKKDGERKMKTRQNNIPDAEHEIHNKTLNRSKDLAMDVLVEERQAILEEDDIFSDSDKLSSQSTSDSDMEPDAWYYDQFEDEDEPSRIIYNGTETMTDERTIEQKTKARQHSQPHDQDNKIKQAISKFKMEKQKICKARQAEKKHYDLHDDSDENSSRPHYQEEQAKTKRFMGKHRKAHEETDLETRQDASFETGSNKESPDTQQKVKRESRQKTSLLKKVSRGYDLMVPRRKKSQKVFDKSVREKTSGKPRQDSGHENVLKRTKNKVIAIKKRSRSLLTPSRSNSSRHTIKNAMLAARSKSRQRLLGSNVLKKLSSTRSKTERKKLLINVEQPDSSTLLPYKIKKSGHIHLDKKVRDVPLEIVVKFKKGPEKPRVMLEDTGINTVPIIVPPPPTPPPPPPPPSPPPTPRPPPPTPPPPPPPPKKKKKRLERPHIEEIPPPEMSEVSIDESILQVVKTQSFEDRLVKRLDTPKGLLDQINLLDFKEDEQSTSALSGSMRNVNNATKFYFGGQQMETIKTDAVLQPRHPSRSDLEIRAPYVTSSNTKVDIKSTIDYTGPADPTLRFPDRKIHTRNAYSQTEVEYLHVPIILSPTSSVGESQQKSYSETSLTSGNSVKDFEKDTANGTVWKQKFGKMFSKGKGKDKFERGKRRSDEIIEIITPNAPKSTTESVSLRWEDERPKVEIEPVLRLKGKYVPQVYSGGVQPKDIGYNLHGSFYQPPTSWNKKVLFPPPDDTLDPTDHKVRVSERKTAIDFLYSIGYTREQAAEALVDDLVHRLLHSAIREAHIWVNVIPKDQGMLLLLLAIKCKDNVEVHRRYFHQLAEAVVNCRITRAMQLEGYIEVLNEYIKGNIPRGVLFDEKLNPSQEELDPEVDLKRKTQELFRTVYMYTKHEAGGRRMTKDSNEVKLLRALVANYSTYLQPHLKLLAYYIAQQKIINLKQLKAAIEYLQVYKSEDISIPHFEEFCL